MRRNKILIAVIIIILLLLGGLTYYTFFVRDKAKEDSKPNVKPSSDSYEEFYSTNTADTKEIDEIVTSLPYSNIINKNISHKQLWKTYKIFNAIDNLKGEIIGDSGVNYKDAVKDSEGVNYPIYTTKWEQTAKKCGLSVDEISRINKDYWTTPIDYSYILYDINELKSNYGDIYKNMLTESFIVFKNDAGLRNHSVEIFYDSNVNKLVGRSSGGTASPYKSISIIDRKKDNNLYIVEIKEKMISYNPSDMNELRTEEDLGNYIITFNLVNGYYQFDNIVKK